jgi:hypothetical protein
MAGVLWSYSQSMKTHPQRTPAKPGPRGRGHLSVAKKRMLQAGKAESAKPYGRDR